MSTILQRTFRTATAVSLATVGSLALAAGGDTGTGGVADMEMSGGQFMLLIGGAVAIGIVLWLVVKLMNR
ncbi:hypothetical protein [Uliginosibacterium sp. H1]|uniref:hypothetical protein n=1 Tax=Uliginosibacterium sp. H1 TaxID=3114757 RepID=UPI002E182184|nr:hypothetical protein [Uliginosibacterium sp. H1]